MRGRVVKSTGSQYLVHVGDAKILCRARGKLRLEGIKESNPIAVGDWVEITPDGTDGVIEKIYDRQNHVLRQSVKRTEHSSVLAANVDQAWLMATVFQPRTSIGFIDRFLVACEAFRIPQAVLFNKSDLWGNGEWEELEVVKKMYEPLGIQVYTLSAQHDPNFENLKAQLEGKVTLLAGHSGVGKSTLLNRLSDSINQSVQAISEFHQKGMHTTTFAEMFELNPSTFIIDTPGVKEWGLVDMGEQELSDYFPEMRAIRLDCKFGARCLHLHEPGCAVIKATEAGVIALSRYQNYVSMVTGKDNRK